MGKLDEFFKLVSKEESKKSDLELLDEIEERLNEDNLEAAIILLRDIKKEHNLFLALRMILRKMATIASGESETSIPPQDLRIKLREIALLANTILNPVQRAVLLSDLAVLFYHLDDDLNGDIALRTAIDLTSDHPNVMKDIVMNLINNGLLEKAAYAMKLVKDPEKLDTILVQLAEMFYRQDQIEKATMILKHIVSPFHKAMALYSIASIVAERDKEEAKRILDLAFRIADKIKDPNSRFEINMKLYELKGKLEGQDVTLEGILSRSDSEGDQRPSF